jgi:hypothetical protein
MMGKALCLFGFPEGAVGFEDRDKFLLAAVRLPSHEFRNRYSLFIFHFVGSFKKRRGEGRGATTLPPAKAGLSALD